MSEPDVPSKQDVIRALESIGSDMDNFHALTSESSWEDIQDRIGEFQTELEEIFPPTYLVDEENEAWANHTTRTLRGFPGLFPTRCTPSQPALSAGEAIGCGICTRLSEMCCSVRGVMGSGTMTESRTYQRGDRTICSYPVICDGCWNSIIEPDRKERMLFIQMASGALLARVCDFDCLADWVSRMSRKKEGEA